MITTRIFFLESLPEGVDDDYADEGVLELTSGPVKLYAIAADLDAASERDNLEDFLPDLAAAAVRAQAVGILDV